MSLKLFKSFSIYTVAGFFGAGANFLVLPILSRYLTPEDYGIQAIFNSYVLILIPLISLVSSGYLSIEYYRKSNKEDYASLFSSVQLIPIIPFLLIFTGAVLFYKPIGNLLEIPDGSSTLVWMIVVLALLTIYIESFSEYLVIRKRSTQYFLFNVLKTSLEITLTVVFVVYYQLGWHGRIYAWFIATSLFFVVSLFCFYKDGLFTLHIDLQYYKAGVIYGLPLILNTLGRFVINQSDRIFIAKLLGVSDVGYYNMAYQISSIILIFVNIFQKVYTPFVYERLSNIDERKKTEILRLIYAFFIALLLLLLIISFVGPLLFGTVIDGKYKGSIPYIFWISLSYVFWGVYIVFIAFIYYYKKSSYMAYVAIVNICSNLILNYFLIKKFGVVGAAYATSISYFVTLVLVAIYANKLARLPWSSFNTTFSPLLAKIKKI